MMFLKYFWIGEERNICVCWLIFHHWNRIPDRSTFRRKVHFDPQSQRVSVLQCWLGMAAEALMAEARPIEQTRKEWQKTQARIKLSETLQDPLTSTKKPSCLRCSTGLQNIAAVWETGLQNRSLVGWEHFKHKA